MSSLRKTSRSCIPEELKKYDAIVFYTTGELPIGDAEKANLLAWIKSGKGFIGIHCATDTFYKWADYGDMIGGYFDEHPWHQEVKVKVEDPNTPATKGLPNPWVLTDEIYQFKDWDRRSFTCCCRSTPRRSI